MLGEGHIDFQKAYFRGLNEVRARTVPAFFIDFIGLLAINWIRCLNGSKFKYYFGLYDI